MTTEELWMKIDAKMSIMDGKLDEVATTVRLHEQALANDKKSIETIKAEVKAEFDKLPHVIALDVDAIAREIGSPRSANMVLLGATAAVLSILDADKLRDGIRRIFGRKGEDVVEVNIKAFDAGLQFSLKNK